jgi:hypothetical protein
MLVIHGTYQFRPERIAYRNDYCLTCEAPRQSVQVRTFDAVHLFWIPLIPLGFHKQWICRTCGKQPDVSAKTRRPFKWIGVFLLLLFGGLFWFEPLDPNFLAGTWFFRIGAPVGAVLLLVHLLRTPPDTSRKARLMGVLPAAETECPFCRVQLLMLGSKCSCPKCGVVRL